MHGHIKHINADEQVANVITIPLKLDAFCEIAHPNESVLTAKTKLIVEIILFKG